MDNLYPKTCMPGAIQVSYEPSVIKSFATWMCFVRSLNGMSSRGTRPAMFVAGNLFSILNPSVCLDFSQMTFRRSAILLEFRCERLDPYAQLLLEA